MCRGIKIKMVIGIGELRNGDGERESEGKRKISIGIDCDGMQSTRNIHHKSTQGTKKERKREREMTGGGEVAHHQFNYI